jgi:hypothetical protein
MAAGATYEPIATQTLASAAASITFSSIAASWTDLRVVWTGQTTSTTSAALLLLSLNGVTSGSLYSGTSVAGYGSGTLSSSFVNNNYISPNYVTGTIDTNQNMATFDIFSYTGSTYKTILCSAASDFNGSGTVISTVGLFRSTSTITSLSLLPNTNTFAIGTTATLYGIKAA